MTLFGFVTASTVLLRGQAKCLGSELFFPPDTDGQLCTSIWLFSVWQLHIFLLRLSGDMGILFERTAMIKKLDSIFYIRFPESRAHYGSEKRRVHSIPSRGRCCACAHHARRRKLGAVVCSVFPDSGGCRRPDLYYHWASKCCSVCDADADYLHRFAYHKSDILSLRCLKWQNMCRGGHCVVSVHGSCQSSSSRNVLTRKLH